MKYYQAPWAPSLVTISTAATVVCLGAALSLFLQGHGWLPWMASLPLALIIGSALFTIRGYSITPNAILVHRLFWKTRLPFSGFESAEFKPDAMRKSVRTFGNGGLFSFTGWFYSKALGAYRAFVTNPHLTVVLRYSRRIVVLSPASPEQFVHDLPSGVHSV
jgi:hypothetical protein